MLVMNLPHNVKSAQEQKQSLWRGYSRTYQEFIVWT